MRWTTGIWALALVGPWALVGGLGGCATTHTERRVQLEGDAKLAASGACAGPIIEELASGSEAPAADPRCAEVRSKARKRHAAGQFGFVRQRRANLRAVTLLLGEGVRCRELPLREERFAVLTERRVRDAGCAARDYRGSVAVYGVRADGTLAPIGQVEAKQGNLRVRYIDLDAQARAGGWLDGLHAFEAVELGDRGWAGTIDLVRLRLFLANWHLDWVERGRGSAGLFAARHPEHLRVDDAQALAFEETLSRQERDYLDVAAGEMRPDAFLARHVWSPYRSSVENIGARPESDPEPTPDPEPEPEPEPGS